MTNITIRLDEDTLKKVKKIAKEQSRTISSQIRLFIKQSIENEKCAK